MRFKTLLTGLLLMCLSAHADEPRLFIAASFSMPNDLLKSYLEDANEHDAFIVFQGLKNNDLISTMAASRALNQDVDLDRVLIDPNLFERYKIQHVPTFILTADPYPCDGMLCVAEHYDILSGAVTTQYALEKMQKEGDVIQLMRGEQ